jgi:hypothetical protein
MSLTQTKFYGIRWLNRLYAFIYAYYWLRCPVCNEYYGGHEHGGPGLPSGSCTCSKMKCINRAYELWNNVSMHAFTTKDNGVAYVEYDHTTQRYLHERKKSNEP